MFQYTPDHRIDHLHLLLPQSAIIAFAQPGQVQHLLPALAQQTHHHIRQLPPGHALIQHRHHFAAGLLGTGLALFCLANPLFHTIGAAFLIIEEVLKFL